MAAILVFQNNKTVAMLVFQTYPIPVGVQKSGSWNLFFNMQTLFTVPINLHLAWENSLDATTGFILILITCYYPTTDSTYSFKCSVPKTSLTLVFKLHLSLLIHSTKTLSFNSIQHCTYQLRTYSPRKITVSKRNELKRNAACKTLQRKAQFWKCLSLFFKCSKQ